jgi:2-oxoglutarate ferredoxin oxidoreductase subunit alpha
MPNDRLVLKFAGQSGQGINTLGEILSKSVKDSGFYNFAYREYPSLIRGGVASYQVDIAGKQIMSSSKYCDILTLLNDSSKESHLNTVRMNGIVIHGPNELELTDVEKKYIEKNSVRLISLDTFNMALEAGGSEIMANMVLMGFIWRLLSLKTDPLEEIVKDRFKDKGVDLEAEIKCVEAGYNSDLIEHSLLKPITFKSKRKLDKALSITGNDAISLGAITAGCRGYYAYPMTPATSILRFIGNTYKETGILVKQAESEITAAQMVMGSMNMGTRAMTATSGGGFDLMTETVSCAGISETPMVIVLAQRTGAGTGVPTWTGAGDLSIAVNSGHGEFPRCVIAVSNPNDAYIEIQNAFNIAEVYQLPVIVLTEKQIAESIFCIDKLPKPVKIERGIKDGENRYELTENGISPRWQPSESNPVVLVNSDEHTEDGYSTEISQEIIEMSDKRLRKMDTLIGNIPEPEYFGPKQPNTVFITYGSPGNTVKDILNTLNGVGCIHYKYIYPLKFEMIEKFSKDNVRLVTVENNQTGEFAKLIRRESGIKVDDVLLKYDGRPFFVEDIVNYINKVIN